ncbi:uncharacterized protein V6R79_003091 [Siganus canaliculatus]
MDDSDQDFVDLCPKLPKRPRKKPGDARQPRRAEEQPSSQQSDGDKKRRNHKVPADSGARCAGIQSVCPGGEAEKRVVCGETGDAGPSCVNAEAKPKAEKRLSAKDKVLDRMQQFKRSDPPRMVHRDKSQRTEHQDCVALPQSVQGPDTPESLSSGFQPDPLDSDEALALQLQQELDREAAEVQTVDLVDGGLFFCQICQRDLTHMSPEGRTQHLNRCLDECEGSTSVPPPPPPAPTGVPDCPICGKKFKSQKSRSVHLKRCSSDMGVAPAVLLQVLQRQAEEIQSTPAASVITDTGASKRKGPSKPCPPAKKKPRKKTEALDEETMVALALSSSLLEQERELDKPLQPETAAFHASMTPALKWRPDTGKGRGKRKKGAVPRPPPLLLVQNAEDALRRLQERVSALLLRTRAPSPPTPTRCPSDLPRWNGAAPLWLKSALLNEGASCQSDFYTPELREFITPWESTACDAASSRNTDKPESSIQPASEGTPVAVTMASVRLDSSQAAAASSAPSTPGTGHLSVGSQTLRDLMELAEDGMTLSQCGFSASGPDRDKSAGLHLSGFIHDGSEEADELCVSGFLPQGAASAASDNTCSRASRTTEQSEAEGERGRFRTVALSRLASDLSSMVNNPQLSDVQLQVDSGEVYFAHSFMVYARCPLLAEMVHESGFGVQEEGMAAAQRVLMSDVPGPAVFALLQYLYTGQCSISASLRPHVLELASRLDLPELQQLCELCREDASARGDEEDNLNLEENVSDQTDRAFVELLRSMWNQEDEDNEDEGADGGSDGEKELEHHPAAEVHFCEEKVNEEELEEIYDFVATQRKREEESLEEEEEEEEKMEEEEDDEVFRKPKCISSDLADKSPEPKLILEPDPSLDRSYSRLFSESWGIYEEGLPCSSPSTSAQLKTLIPRSQKQLPAPKPSSQVSARTLLQSSASVVDDPSLSPPTNTSNLPVPGHSPGRMSDREPDAPDQDVDPALPPQKEPELIVLSDSSDEMEVALSPQNRQSYTQIKHQPVAESNKPHCQSPVQSHADCSPEVSWLIPSTPLQLGRSSTSSSTQTRSSMCRTQLFPKGDSSSSSPAFNSKSPNKVSPTEASVSRLDPEDSAPSSSSFDKFCPQRTSSCDLNKAASSRSKSSLSSSRCSSKQETPLHLQSLPSSSTPLHTELRQPPAPPVSSPLRSHVPQQMSSSEGRDETPPESPGSFHLSPLSDPASSSLKSPRSSQRLSSFSPQVSRHDDAGCELTGREVRDAGEGEADVPDSSFRQSFMDMGEPPMAFNDSWGLDACVDVNPGCFSLRLEDSRGSSLKEQSPGQQEIGRCSSSTDHQTSPSGSCSSHKAPPKAHSSREVPTGAPVTPPTPPDPTTRTTPEVGNSLLDSKIWDSWEEDEEETVLPLSQRVNPSARLKTPRAPRDKRRRTIVPITPMPHYSDMDTPELKNKLNRFGVRPLPKRQMILKLKEIHQYTHQLVNSDSEDEAPSTGRSAHVKPPPSSSCAQTVKFKEPRAPADVSPLKNNSREEQGELLSASQGSNTSSTAASEESERSNPELCPSSDGDSDSDGGISASQAVVRLQDRLQAVRSFILSDSELYTQILHYQPLVLSQLQQRLKAAGIRLGVAKLVDYLDSQCITFTTAKPGHSAPSRRRVKKTGKTAGRKRDFTAAI